VAYLCRFNDTYNGDQFTYEEEELEPPPPEEGEEEGAEGESQLNRAVDDQAGLNETRVNGTKAQTNQIIATGNVKAATAESKAIPPDQRSTTPYMTKYEKARILGTRALQIR
jgi:DNA-directed RNA polymerases I, II, and III subunit RPABC2